MAYTKKLFLLIVMVLILPVLVLAGSQNSINLLTVSELENGDYQGGVASLELTIEEGTGAIFIESFPLSNIDTQAVTRIATDIACSYSSKDCDHYDFFYTIRTSSGYVRGPSAGGATALLALATLENINLPTIAMTGGINSGGLITPVGGVKEKVGAAVEKNIELILIPALSLNITSEVAENNSEEHDESDESDGSNESEEGPLFLEDMQTSYQSVHAIYSLSEAYFIATGNQLSQKTIAEPPLYYTSTMKKTSQLLCQRSLNLFEELEGYSQENISEITIDYYNKSLGATANGDYYSAASYCYSANTRLRSQVVGLLSEKLLKENLNKLNSSLDIFEKQIDDYSLETFSDLEAYIIVKERLNEARDHLQTLNQTNISTHTLALAIERYYSAVAWSSFFGLEGEPLVIDEKSLEAACIKEIKEVESRSNYLKTTIPFALLDEVYIQLNAAYEQYNNNNYALCIFKASKAKANAHLFMNEIQTESQLEQISRIKFQRSEELIHDQQQEGIFPIIGYSYYEYAQQLREDQPYTSLLFVEYSLSMADVTKYFPKASSSIFYKLFTFELFYLLIGLILGVVITKLLEPKEKVKPKAKSKAKPKKRNVRKK